MPANNLFHFIEIPKIFDNCFLYFAQNPDHIPFSIKRVYFITQASPQLPRGHHVHKKTKQMMFCIQGSVKLTLDNGKKRQNVIIDQPDLGVMINNMVWHEMTDFKKNTILLVLASSNFDEKDYIRDYEKFKKQADKIR